MKNKLFFSFVLSVLSLTLVMAQNVTTRTNEFEVDFSDPKKQMYTTIPVINWVSPVPETNYAQEMNFKIEVEIESCEGGLITSIIVAPRARKEQLR